VALLFTNFTKKIPSVPQDTSHDFTSRKLHFEFVLPYLPYSPNLGPTDFHFLAPWRMPSKEAILRMSCNTAHWRALTLQQRILQDRYTASLTKVERVCW